MSANKNMRAEQHATAHKVLVQIHEALSKASVNTEIRIAHDQAPEIVTQGRSYAQIAMDDVLDHFVFIMKDLPDNEVPYDFYRLAKILREGDDNISLDEARAEAIDRMDFMRNQLIVQRDEMPQFIKVVKDRVDLVLLQNLQNLWMRAVNSVHSLNVEENTLQSFNSTQVTSQLFNRAMARTFQERQEHAKMLAELDKLNKKSEPGAPKLEEAKMSGELKTLLGLFGEEITASKSADEQVIARDADVKRVLSALMREDAPYALTVGAEGIGKSAITRALAQEIADGNVPEELQNAMIVRLKLREMKAGSGTTQAPHHATGEARMVEQYTEWLRDILLETAAHNAQGGQQIILNIDELGHLSANASGTFQTKEILCTAMRENAGLRIVGELTEVQRKKIESYADDLLENFTEVKIKPLSTKDAIDALRRNGFAAQDEELLRKTIEWSNQFVSTGEQPGKALTTLRRAKGAARIAGEELSEDHVAQVLSEVTGRPRHMFGKSKSEQMAELERELPNRVLGQPVIQDMLRIIKAGNSSLQDPNKPIASILSVGPTGNGKTETAKAIADLLGIPLVTIDMSNYQDQHAKSKLLGAPPGYVGFDKKAALEDVADNPYCVLLLDEIDKAHPEAHNVFLSILDEGRQQLMNGKTVNFNNTIIIMTSNFGARAAQEAKDKVGIGFNAGTGGDEAANIEYKNAINAKMPPEYQNRLDLIAMYGSLSQDVMKKIALQKINKVSNALRQSENLNLVLSQEAIDQLSAPGVGYSPQYGARPLDRAIKNLVKVPLLEWLEDNHKDKSTLQTVFVSSVNNGKFDAVIRPAENDNNPNADAKPAEKKRASSTPKNPAP